MNSFFLLFIGIPALEVFLFIKIGGQVGALNTIALIFLTAIIGLYFARLQGIQTLKSGMVNFYQNKLPIYEMMSGASIAIAAIMLIIPGFFTDVIGFLLLIPVTRKIFFQLIFKNKNITDIKKKDETIDGEIIEDKKDGQAIIEENAENYSNLNDRLADEKEEKNLQMEDFQGELNEDIDDLKEKLIQEYAEGQTSIEKNAESYTDLNDRLTTQKEEEVLMMIDKTSEVYNQTTDLKEKIGEEQKDGQQKIESNAKEYENVSDRLAKENANLSQEGLNKTSEVYNQTTDLKEGLIKNQKDGQAIIEKNAKG